MATDYLKLAQEAFDASTTFIDANYRKDWEYSIRAFRNEHAAGSKYLSEDFKARSRIFPPYTRSIIRKNEAAGAVALFSNMEVVNLTPGNPDDLISVASCEAMKQILEYRLSRTIPAFQVCMGGIQDAQVQGAVCSYQYWEYEKRDGRKIKDKPCIELRPIENIRIDGGANWLDPVTTSPYFCDIIPMYVCDVKGMMENKDDKTNQPKWKKYDDEIISKARPDDMDTTRKARLGDQQDPIDETTKIKNFDIVWVMRWFMKDSQGDDQVFYTLGTEKLLTDPKPIDEVYFHGKRPYVIGYSILETHKVMKTSMPMMIKPLQQEGAEIRNQRLDNVKFVLNKRWLVARGRQVDVQSLVRNVPGGVTLVTDPKTDIVESNWPDVTSSAFVEQDRLKADIDELAGNFSPNTKVANNAVNDTLGGSRLANQSAGVMTDYLLRTIIETWWEPVLRQLVMLEQYYETDEVVLGVCANKARLFPRFGISRITDSLLMNEVNITVNVGMGASNPQQRMQNFLMAAQASNQLIMAAPPGANVQEQVKEVWSNAGYRDGARFYNQQQDPRLIKAMQMVQSLHQQLQGKQMELQQDAQVKALGYQSTEKIKAAELFVDQGRINGDLQIRQSELVVEQQRINLEAKKLEIEAARVEIERMKVLLEGKSKDIDNQMKQSGMTGDLAVKQAQLALDQQKLDLERLKITIDAHIADIENESKAEDRKTDQEIASLKIENERQKLHGQILKLAQELEKGQQEIDEALIENDTVKTESTAQAVSDAMKAISEEIKSLREQVKQENEGNTEVAKFMVQGMDAIAKTITTPKKKPKSITLKKGPDKKTQAIVVSNDDGSVDEIPVG
jgi:hypothetical protein